MLRLYRRILDTKAVRLVLYLYERFDTARLPILAAALAYYATFSLGPLLLLLAGGLGVLFRNRPDIAEGFQSAIIIMLSQLMPLQDPEISRELAETSFRALVSLLEEGAVWRGIMSVLVLLWASSNFFTSLQVALEIIFDSPAPRAYWRKRLVALLLVFAVAAVIGVEVIGTAIMAYFQSVAEVVRLGLERLSGETLTWFPEVSSGIRLLNDLLRAIITTLAFTLSFRFLPRKTSSWRGALAGALFCTATILLTRRLLGFFIDVERFNLIYGLITSLLLLLFWLYIALQLFLVGALVTAEISRLNFRQKLEAQQKAAALSPKEKAVAEPQARPERLKASTDSPDLKGKN